MKVSTGFESGRIEVLEVDDRRARLAVPPDVAAPRFRQWFAFDVEADIGQSAQIVIDNAAECTWGDALGGDYRVYVSDAGAWRRASSRVDKGKLVVQHTFERPRLRIAYYPPFPSSRITALRKLIRSAGGAVTTLGVTPAGLPMERLSIGTGEANVWVVAQQHPGESMAGWFVEGLVTALCRGGEAATRLRERATISIVPRMNPDGVAVGNHRTTPLGIDLNRVWSSADAPIEVASVRAAMQKTGVQFALDVHGDERLPWVFAQAADRYDGRPKAIDRAITAFEATMVKASPDYQTQHKYPHGPGGKPNVAFCSNWIQATFQCAALTLEMPFSDHRGRPDPRGFFPARARRLGGRAIHGILAAVEAFEA